jgi:hypothetical protein
VERHDFFLNEAADGLTSDFMLSRNSVRLIVIRSSLQIRPGLSVFPVPARGERIVERQASPRPSTSQKLSSLTRGNMPSSPLARCAYAFRNWLRVI